MVAETTGLEWEQWCKESALWLRRPQYLAMHREVKADPIELQQIPVELPLRAPVVGGSSVGDIGYGSERHLHAGREGRGCQCQRIAGPVGSWVSSKLGTGHTHAVMTHWHQEWGISIPSASSLGHWEHRALCAQFRCGQSQVPALRQVMPCSALNTTELQSVATATASLY